MGMLAGKTALVTGSTQGIGLATARLFAAEGARVMLNGRRQDRLDAAVTSCGARAVGFRADVGIADQAEALVAEAVTIFGGLDICVNCAGVLVPSTLEDLTPQVFAEHLAVNVTGLYAVARRAALHMRARGGGTIVNVASEQSLMGMPLYVHYGAAKHAVLGLTRAMAAELAPVVTVTAICPGPVDTPMLESEIVWFGDTPEVRKGAWDRVPMKRLASPEEVARAILFLAHETPFATGSFLQLDGGTTAI